MEVEDILVKAKTRELPEGWTVFPLLRKKIIQGIIGWTFSTILGLGLFALILPVVFPYNYQLGALSIIVTTFFLAILLFVGIGSLTLLITDIRRLMHLDQHLIVITDTDFVKQEGNKIIHVPLSAVRYVTPRGRPPVDRTASAPRPQVQELPSSRTTLLGMFMGHRTSALATGQPPPPPRRKRTRTPTSLAFIDTRSDTEVTVVNDAAYGDPFAIAAALKQSSTSVK